MPRHSFLDRSKAESDREITRKTEQFDAGMMTGPPASEIPVNSQEKLYNAVAFPKWIQGRYGTNIYSDSGLPAQVGRTGLTGEKVGNVLTSADAAFTEADVSNYWVWSDGTSEEIIGYTNATTVTLRLSGDRAEDTDCHLRGKHNGWHFHKTLKKTVIQLGNDLWIADSLALTSWTLIRPVSYDVPSNALSQFDDYDDDVIVFNSNGIYRLYINTAIPYCYRMNTPVPSVYVTDTPKSDDKVYGRRYIYTTLRISGTDNIRTRLDAEEGAVIEQEGGPNALDSNKLDYGEVWVDTPIGDSTKTQGTLVGATVADAALDLQNLWGAVTDGSLALSINGRLHTVIVDFSVPTSPVSMGDVAHRIQTVMKIFWPDSTCEFGIDGKFKITSGEVDGSTVDSIAAGATGTDITGAGYMNILEALGGVITNNVPYTAPKTVGSFKVPVVGSDPDIPQYHWTHFGIYATTDVGVNGTDPVTGEANNPESYLWLYDLRIAGAFLATRDADGIVTASIGEFEEADEGSILEWDDGDREEIYEYISSTQVRTGGYIIDYDNETKSGACAIGNGRVLRASQTGNVVTRTAGGTFTAADVRKTIFWASGYRSIIVEYLTANTVRVADTTAKADQGATIDPVQRNFHDTVDDESLRPRVKSLVLANRTWTPLPLTNIGQIVPGWLITAARGESVFYYCQLSPAYKYLGGYYLEGYQVCKDVKDAITHIAEFPNRVIFYCRGSVYGGPTNVSSDIEHPGTGDFISVFTGIQILDSEIGLIDYGSLKSISVGAEIMITNEPAVRIFDGFKFGNNMAEDNQGNELVVDYLRSWQAATASAYKNGEYLIWGLK